MDPLNVITSNLLYTNIRGRIATSIFWVAWSRVGIQSLSLLSTLFVARLLSPRDFGLMALAGTWTGMLTMLSEMGVGSAIVQFRDLEERELNAYFWMTFALGTIGYLALYASSPFLEVWFAVDGLSPVLQAVGLVLPLVIIRLVPENLLRKELNLDKVSKAEILATIVGIVTVVG